jgi:GNAT superfamily N-acetyltransferase
MEKIDVILNYTESIARQLHEMHGTSLPADITSNLVWPYYKNIISLMMDSRNGILTAAYKSGKLIGFCFVSFNPDAFSRKIAENRFLLILSIFKFIFFKPILIVDLMGAIFGKVKLIEDFPLTKYPEIFVICVSPDERSTGVGFRLIKKVYELLEAEGHDFLITKTSSKRASSFYLKEGFVLIGSQNRITRKLQIFRRKL